MQIRPALLSQGASRHSSPCAVGERERVFKRETRWGNSGGQDDMIERLWCRWLSSIKSCESEISDLGERFWWGHHSFKYKLRRGRGPAWAPNSSTPWLGLHMGHGPWPSQGIPAWLLDNIYKRAPRQQQGCHRTNYQTTEYFSFPRLLFFFLLKYISLYSVPLLFSASASLSLEVLYSACLNQVIREPI
jgi:hypothetical protein